MKLALASPALCWRPTVGTVRVLLAAPSYRGAPCTAGTVPVSPSLRVHSSICASRPQTRDLIEKT